MARLASDSLSSRSHDYTGASHSSYTTTTRTHQLSSLIMAVFKLLGEGTTTEVIVDKLSTATDSELAVFKQDLALYAAHVINAADSSGRAIVKTLQEIADAVEHSRKPAAVLARELLERLGQGVRREELTQVLSGAKSEALAGLQTELKTIAPRLFTDHESAEAKQACTLFDELGLEAVGVLAERRRAAEVAATKETAIVGVSMPTPTMPRAPAAPTASVNAQPASGLFAWVKRLVA